jgi:hypothetical protein
MIRQASLYAVLLAVTLIGTVNAQQPNPNPKPMPPEFNWSLDEPIIRDRIVVDMGKLGPGDVPGPSELTTMVTWVSNALNRPAIYDLPHIERVPKIRLAAVQHGDQFLSLHDVVSSYDGAKKTIYLPENWSGKTASGISILVHEMVHHLQNVAGDKFECSQWREKLAYVVQVQWLNRYGGSLEKDLDISPLTYLLNTECYIP